MALFYKGLNVLLFFGHSHFHNPNDGRVEKARLLFRHFGNQDDKQDHHQYADHHPKANSSTHPPIHPAIRPTAHMIHYQAPFSCVAISLPSCNPDGRLIATDLLSFFPATAAPRFGPRLGTGGRGQELLPTLVAAKVEGLSITFSVKSSCFVHGHPADGILGHGFRFFHGHAPFLVVLLQLSLRLHPVLLGISRLDDLPADGRRRASWLFRPATRHGQGDDTIVGLNCNIIAFEVGLEHIRLLYRKLA